MLLYLINIVATHTLYILLSSPQIPPCQHIHCCYDAYQRGYILCFVDDALFLVFVWFCDFYIYGVCAALVDGICLRIVQVLISVLDLLYIQRIAFILDIDAVVVIDAVGCGLVLGEVQGIGAVSILSDVARLTSRQGDEG